MLKSYVYSERSEEAGTMLNPMQLTRTMTATFTALEVNKIDRLQVKNFIDEKKRFLQLSLDFTPKMAPIIHPKTILDQVETIWKYKTPTTGKAVLKRKQAALIYLLATLSMRRWIDICRLRWTDIQWIDKDHGTFIMIRMHVSKANTGEKMEKVTVAAQPKNWACPIKLLARFWCMQNKPTEGFIFKCLNRLNGNQCPGHRGRFCQGFEVGDATMATITRIAKKEGWEVTPTKHTGRRTGVATTSLNNIPKERILETAGWTSTTDMLRHYTADTQAVRPDGIANMFAEELQKKQPFQTFKNLHL